jgi:hypothetical protein
MSSIFSFFGNWQTLWVTVIILIALGFDPFTAFTYAIGWMLICMYISRANDLKELKKGPIVYDVR